MTKSYGVFFSIKRGGFKNSPDYRFTTYIRFSLAKDLSINHVSPIKFREWIYQEIFPIKSIPVSVKVSIKAIIAHSIPKGIINFNFSHAFATSSASYRNMIFQGLPPLAI